MTERLVSSRVGSIAADRIALEHGDKALTYGELNRQARGLAAVLRSLGAGRDAAIAVCLPRGFDQIIAELAAMYAGAAFVPVDITLPDDRIDFVVQDSGARVVVQTADATNTFGPHVAVITPQASNDVAFLAEVVSGEDLAYIIYTSGSTGTPKGCMLTHGNLQHLVDWHLEAFAVTETDRATHLAGLGFDASVWEVWPYLCAGATVCLVEDATRIDPVALQQWMVQQKISIGFVPTPLAELMVTSAWPQETALRMLLTGGDTLHAAGRDGMPFVLVNNYGPTECTVVATSGVVAHGAAGLPSIGKAIQGAYVYVLDEANEQVAAGEEGELYVGGTGVGAGYRNLPQQTAERFLHDPFHAGGRMYRTGDRVKQCADGSLQFMGRVDGQVKIRGYRIELEEIATVLNQHETVSFSVVVPNETREHLIAYVLLHEGVTATPRMLQNFLAETLPAYMIPARFVRIANVPLTSNGKVNRAVLEEPSASNLLVEPVAAETENEIESTLLEIVRGALNNPAVTVEDDFFLVGGHSLMATQVMMKAYEVFHVDLSLEDLFEAGTVAELAKRVEEKLMERLSGMSEEEAARLAGSF